MPQAFNFLIEKWDFVSKAPDIIIGIILFCGFICYIIVDKLYKLRYEGTIEQLKETNNSLKESNNTLTERLKSKDEEINQLKSKVDNTKAKGVEKPKAKTIKEFSNKEIAGITINIVKEIQQSIQQWENYNEKNNPTKTEKQMLLMNEYFSKYLDNTIALKREISARIYPETTEIIEGFYIGANEKDSILIVCNDLITLANKINIKK
jgi:hypothetical protein